MTKKDISKIVGKKLTDSISSSEEIELKEWLSASENNQIAYQKIKSVWECSTPDEGKKNTDVAYHRLQYRLQKSSQQENRRISLMRWKIAVSILILVSVGLSADLLWNNNRSSYSMILQTGKGQRSFAQLPDGSEVWLNADTKLEVGDFSKKNRTITLSGEAQFHVVHDSKHPFVVSCNMVDVTVLGTIFNVRAYEDDKVIKTSLLEGSVLVKTNNKEGASSVCLKPGQVAVFDKKKESFVVENERNVEENISWRHGISVFHSIPFNQLIHELERNYNVKIFYKESDFTNMHYSGTIDNLKITQVLDILSYTMPIQYKMDKNIINITRKK